MSPKTRLETSLSLLELGVKAQLGFRKRLSIRTQWSLLIGLKLLQSAILTLLESQSIVEK